MAPSKLMMMVVVVLAIASFRLPSAAAQTRHVVGGAFGWNIPNAATTYTTWASGQTFNVGDTLFFNFTTGNHDVTEVSQAAYGPCTTANPASRTTTGPATVTLRTPGNHYYICGVGTHCQLGQKITINVAGATASPPASTTPAPAGSTTPSPAGSTTPSPAGSTSPPPPPPSSASSFAPVVPVAFLAGVVAFLY